MSELPRTPERGRDTGLNAKLQIIAERALALRKDLDSDVAAVSQAMRGTEFDRRDDPKRNSYFGKIMGRLERLQRKPISPFPEPQPKKEPPKVKSIPQKPLKESMSEKAWKRMITDAQEHESLHPADAYGNDEAA